MRPKKLGVIAKGQDGVVFNDYLFRFQKDGSCSVYSLCGLRDGSEPASRFILDKTELIVPHCNCVAFGSSRYCETDEFPLLYCNVYNNYAGADNRMDGVTCVYRLERDGAVFSTTLLQLIEIGFTDDPLWRSAGGDVRPYGNFAIDAENGIYYAFTMRDEDRVTRYFAFSLPGVEEGVYDGNLGIKRAILGKEDIREYFDCDYHRYIQGACFHDGILYSLEGFTDSQENPPAIRLIDVKRQRQERLLPFACCDLHIEPELIDFKNGVCYYADHDGAVFVLDL